MATPGISPAQLKRCRKLVITDISEDNKDRWKLEVLDPKEIRVMNTLYARTPQDLSRMQSAMISKFRIPKENVRSVDKNGEVTYMDKPKRQRKKKVEKIEETVVVVQETTPEMQKVDDTEDTIVTLEFKGGDEEDTVEEIPPKPPKKRRGRPPKKRGGSDDDGTNSGAPEIS